MTSVAERLQSVQNSIDEAARAASRDPSGILVLAVSKKQSVERVQLAYELGVRDFGENYVQGLEGRVEYFGGWGGHDMRWHFVGQIQSNKAKRLLGAHLIHSVDSPKLATLLGAAATAANTVQACLLNVNISEQQSKSGVRPNALPQLLSLIDGIRGIDVQGLMCVPDPAESPRTAFARLRQLRDRVQPETDFQLRELSMGMSDSYQDAIAEGATIVRIGTGIFGPRE